jgi:hypothetical protein
MASIPKELMDEFHSMAVKAREDDSYLRGIVFNNAEGMVNNFLHGRPPAEVLSLTKKAFESTIVDERIPLDEEEKDAYREAIAIIDTFAELYELTLN